MKILEFLTATLPLLGALLISYNMMEGFYIFLVASTLSIFYFNKTKQKWLLLQSVAFTLINFNGIYQNFIK